MTVNKLDHIDDVEYLLRSHDVDPSVIQRAQQINEATKTKLSKSVDRLNNVCGGIFLCGISATQTTCWQMCIPLFLLATFTFFTNHTY